jgi:hypothetical protein
MLLRHPCGCLSDSETQSVSTLHNLLALGGQPFPLLAFGGSLSLELFDPLFERSAPRNRISLKGPGKEQQRCEFCTQRRRIFALVSRPSHTSA